MKSFKEYCESEAPATVNDNVGKPQGMVKKKKVAEPPEPVPEPKSFKEIFGNVFGDLFKKK